MVLRLNTNACHNASIVSQMVLFLPWGVLETQTLGFSKACLIGMSFRELLKFFIFTNF